MRRKGQNGSVFQKGRRIEDDDWSPIEPAYLRFWRDVPGQAERRREVVPLGICRTRTIAEGKAAQKLEELGINNAQKFHEANSRTTFKQQSRWWLKSLAQRKRSPVEQTTIDTRRYALEKWVLPFFGDRTLGEINNLALKELVEEMSETLAASSIRDYSNIVKAVVASAIDANGEQLFPRKWNDDFIDAPLITRQHQPSTTSEGMTKILEKSAGQYRVLYALLAGCGPLRAGEALGLEVDKHISSDFRTLHIQQKAKRGIIQPYLKTKAGEREVDLCVSLAKMLKDFVGNRTEGLLFHTSTGAQLLQANTLQDSLHPALEKLKHAKGGFNIFRRYRITHLKKTDCPEALQHFWSGHAHSHISERYTKLLTERDYRLEWTERIGLGFELPRSVGQLGQLRIVPKVA